MTASSSYLDEQQLRAAGELDEVGSADDSLDVVVQVAFVQVHHVCGHPAGPQVTARGDDLFEQFGYLGYADVVDLLAHLAGRHGGHAGQAAQALWQVGGGVAERGEL